MEFTREDLREFQAESLEQKIQRTLGKVSEWYSYWHGEVYVSFSGGKDSTVLADICAKWCRITGKTLYLVFVNTGLEFPEIQKHVRFFAEWLREKYQITVELDIVRPEMRFDEVIRKYGYPVISKRVGDTVSYARKNIRDGKMDTQRVRLLLGNERRRDGNLSIFNAKKWKPLLYTDFEVSANCCNVMKKKPFKVYQKRTKRMPIVATMTVESPERENRWLKLGCNSFNSSTPMSTPMAFWTEQDVLQYIAKYDVPIASVYGNVVNIDNRYSTTGCDRTGCVFCGFGCHLEKEPRFKRLKETHPRQYEYCIGGGEYDENGVWKPGAGGLGMGHVFDELNAIYGENFIEYK